MKKAVILFSGGLDSTTCLALAKHQGYECYALSFDYNQRHAVELTAAAKIAKHYQTPHTIFPLNINEFKGSALTDLTLNVPDYAESNQIPITYVPARNTIFLSIALAWAEVLNAFDIFMGVSFIDYSNYPDCRPEYIQAYQHMANLATKKSVEGNQVHIHTPFIHLSKAKTIQLGLSIGVDYSMTISCYSATSDGKACGRCDCCALRKKGFKEANVVDPTRYVSEIND